MQSIDPHGVPALSASQRTFEVRFCHQAGEFLKAWFIGGCFSHGRIGQYPVQQVGLWRPVAKTVAARTEVELLFLHAGH